jgi:class 3 adenylate cyclase
MEADEAGTLERLKDHRRRVFDPCVAAHGGRVVKLMGDGALVEFGSVFDAVTWSTSTSAPSASTRASRRWSRQQNNASAKRRDGS